MYDTFDNTYQATIGIDFLSKVRPPPFYLSDILLVYHALRFRRLIPSVDRPCISTTAPYAFNFGTQQARNDSEV
jgi:hypothetical protein